MPQLPKTQQCTKCNKRKPLNTDHYYYEITKAKYRLQCIACYKKDANKRQKARYRRLKNDPHFRAIQRASINRWRKNHPDVMRIARRRHREAYKKKHPMQYRLQRRLKWKRYLANNPEKVRERHRLWWKKHPDKLRAKKKRQLLNQRLYRPEVWRAARDRRNARRREKHRLMREQKNETRMALPQTNPPHGQ